MQFNFKVKNFGRITEIDVPIHPFTVIAGPNSSGKSFFTKSLYAFLRTIKTDYVFSFLYENTASLEQAFLQLKQLFNEKEELVQLEEKIKDYLAGFTVASKSNGYSTILDKIAVLNTMATYFQSCLDDLKKFENSLSAEEKTLAKEKLMALSDKLKNFIEFQSEFEIYLNELAQKRCEYSLSSNFQDDIVGLSGNKQQSIELSAGDIKFEFGVDSTESDISIKALSHFGDIQQIVYLESPVYWKLKEPLKRLQQLDANGVDSLLSNKLQQGRLSGVPEHFYDLISLLELRLKRSKDRDNLNSIGAIAQQINEVIGGELTLTELGEVGFVSKGSDKLLSLHATASGVTSYGLISLLIVKGVITPGSFIIIDEPEINLHPAWQVQFIRHLFELSRLGITIVLATHSNDVMECVAALMDRHDELVSQEHFSIHRFSLQGKLLDEDKDVVQRVAAIKLDLTEPLIQLMTGE